jgi:hypothetical protein
VNYDQAHKYCVETFDRKKGKGTELFTTLLKTNTEMVFDECRSIKIYSSMVSNVLLSTLVICLNWVVTLINPKYKHKKVAYTVKEFAQRFNKGNYIISVAKHALAVKDGVVVDNGNYQVGGYRRPVASAFIVA